MIEITIPGTSLLHIEHLVLDFNGTLALRGVLLPEVRERLVKLTASLALHVVTGDTFGTAERELRGLPCEVVSLPPVEQGKAKLSYVRDLGAERVACIGNGNNDRLMLAAAALGIAVVQAEGATQAALAAAKIVCPSIVDALDLLIEPKSLVATLRS